MTDLKDILVSGKAGNDDLNVTTIQATAMAGYFGTLMVDTPCRIEGVYINTTEQGANPAQMINVGSVNPFPPMNMKFFYQVRVQSPLLWDPYYWSCSQFLAMIESSGLEYATRFFLNEAVPGFSASNYLTIPNAYSQINDYLNSTYASASKE